MQTRWNRIIGRLSLVAVALVVGTSSREVDAAPAAKPSPPAKAPAKSEGQRIVSGDWQITTTASEGYAKNARTGEEIKLFARDGGCEYEVYDAEILSVVGTFVSVELTENSFCGGARPSISTSVYTLDLARGGAAVTIDQIVPKWHLKTALQNDPFLTKQRQAKGSACQLEMLMDTSAFSFHHLEKDKVALRVLVPESCDTGRGEASRIGLLFRPAPWLLARIHAAEKAGTLQAKRR